MVDNIAVALKDPRRKAKRRTDLLLACLIVVVVLELLHFVTPWGKTDMITNLDDAIERGRWTLAAVNAAVLLLCVLLFIASVRAAALHPTSGVTPSNPAMLK